MAPDRAALHPSGGRYSDAVNPAHDDRLRVFADIDFAPLEHPPDWAVGVLRSRRPMPAALESVLMFVIASGAGVLLVLLVVGWGIGTPANALFLGVCVAASLAAIVGAATVIHRWGRASGRLLIPVQGELGDFAERNRLAYRTAAFPERELPSPAGLEHELQRVGMRLSPRDGSGWPHFVIGRRSFIPRDFEPTSDYPEPIPHDEALVLGVPLPRPLPNIALLRRFDPPFSRLDPRTAYAMGSEFDEHFTLLCPPGYERDALYLFTPDVMAAMIDDAGAALWGAEVVDDWLIFTFPPSGAPGAFFAEDLRRAFLLIERTAAELAKQAQNYRDERVEDAARRMVAAGGRRLPTRVPPIVWGAAAVLLGFVAAPTIVVMVAASLS